MIANTNLIGMIQAQIRMEKNTARRITKLEKATANLAARLLLAEMKFDTRKHVKILLTILDVLKRKESELANTLLWDTKIQSYVDTFVAKKMLEDHVKIETRMLKHVEQEMKETNDDALKLLLKHIADDETKHHRIMETVLKKAFEMGP